MEASWSEDPLQGSRVSPTLVNSDTHVCAADQQQTVLILLTFHSKTEEALRAY